VDIVGEQVEPFLQDMTRRDRLGLTDAAAEVGAGVLLGLYSCRGFQGEESVLAGAEDFPDDQACWVAERMRKAGPLPAALAESCESHARLGGWILAGSGSR
jgi:hypothetical protein